MRIVNIMLAKGLGGIEQSFLDYTRVLQAAGHEVHRVMHPRARLLTLSGANTSHVHTLPNWGEWDVLAIARLRRLLASLRPDVVIAHGNRALTLASRAGARHLVTVLHNYKIRMKRAQFVLAPTQDLMMFAQAQGIAAEALHLVPNMVPVPPVMPQREWHTPPVIGAMGRMVAKKGFELLLAALALLAARNVAFRAVIAGDGEEKAALMAIAQRSGLGARVAFPGWVENKQRWFDEVDIFCLPSHHEPFGIVLLEAMAQALPVVATRSEGPSEIIEDGKDGLLVPVGNAAALAEALERLLANQPASQRIGASAYDTVSRHYSPSVVGEKLGLALRAIAAL